MAVKMKIYHLRRRLTLAVITAPLLEIHAEIGAPFTNARPKAELNFKSHGASIWEDEVGKGFRSTTQSFGASAGAACGVTCIGHAMALITRTSV